MCVDEKEEGEDTERGGGVNVERVDHSGDARDVGAVSAVSEEREGGDCAASNAGGCKVVVPREF